MMNRSIKLYQHEVVKKLSSLHPEQKISTFQSKRKTTEFSFRWLKSDLHHYIMVRFGVISQYLCININFNSYVVVDWINIFSRRNDCFSVLRSNFSAFVTQVVTSCSPSSVAAIELDDKHYNGDCPPPLPLDSHTHRREICFSSQQRTCIRLGQLENGNAISLLLSLHNEKRKISLRKRLQRLFNPLCRPKGHDSWYIPQRAVTAPYCPQPKRITRQCSCSPYNCSVLYVGLSRIWCDTFCNLKCSMYKSLPTKSCLSRAKKIYISYSCHHRARPKVTTDISWNDLNENC